MAEVKKYLLTIPGRARPHRWSKVSARGCPSRSSYEDHEVCELSFSVALRLPRACGVAGLLRRFAIGPAAGETPAVL